MTININFPKYEGNFYLGRNMQLTLTVWCHFCRYGMNSAQVWFGHVGVLCFGRKVANLARNMWWLAVTMQHEPFHTTVGEQPPHVCMYICI